MGQHCIDALALDDPLEYTRLILDGEMQTWVNEQDTFDKWTYPEVISR